MTYHAITSVLREVSEIKTASSLQRVKERCRQVLAALNGHGPMISTGEAAEILGVSKNTVKNWLTQKGIARAERTAGGHLRFPLSDILDLKNEMGAAAARRARKKLDVPRAASSDDFN